MYTVSSEIFQETKYDTAPTATHGNIISKFKFRYPCQKAGANPTPIDKDGDLDVRRKGVIELEHSVATDLRLVGLQVWRGALLLADYIFANSEEFNTKTIMELGAGVGLTSIAAATQCDGKIYCTDVDIGCILQQIRENIQRNTVILRSQVSVLEYNFLESPSKYSAALLHAIGASDVVLAADVIYDDTLTDAFIGVIDELFIRGLESSRPKTLYVALEKRFVFTLEDCDAVAPMYEYFIKQTRHKPWIIESLPLDFPQYFDYKRCKQLVLLRITRRS